MAAVLDTRGPVSWEMTQDTDGHREYTVVWQVKSAVTDGPATVAQVAGLPVPGSIWDFTFTPDIDVYAYCKASKKIKPLVTRENNRWWTVEQTFSTKGDAKRCKDTQFDDPLTEPDRISGSFVKDKFETSADRFGDPITNSAWEQITGAPVEFDDGRPTVTIEQNVADLELPLLAEMIQTVNSTIQWGLPPRTIKLSDVSWERKFYGSCAVYYTRKLEFEINFDTFDRDILDEGHKALNGHWEGRAWVLDNIKSPSGLYDYGPPRPSDPKDFIRVQDRNGNPMSIILNGSGIPFDPDNITTGTADDHPGIIHVEYYDESNFFLLGIPASF